MILFVDLTVTCSQYTCVLQVGNNHWNG